MQNHIKQTDDSIEFSVLIPVYNAEKSLPELLKLTRQVFSELGRSYEFVLVDDGSLDQSWSIIESEHEKGDICALRFLRNCGHSITLKRGFEHCRGKWVLTMDDDLQHPPAEIPKLVQAIDDNPSIDVVMGAYNANRSKLHKSLGAKIYQSVIRRAYPIARKVRITSFRLIHRRIVDEIIHRDLAHPNAGFIILDITENITNVPVEYADRAYGQSGMSLSKSFKTLIDGIAMNSTLPLQIIGIGGLLLAGIAFSLTLFYIGQYLLGNIGISGFTTIVLLITGFSGLILFSISVVGLYVGRLISQAVFSEKYSLRNYLPPPDKHFAA